MAERRLEGPGKVYRAIGQGNAVAAIQRQRRERDGFRQCQQIHAPGGDQHAQPAILPQAKAHRLYLNGRIE